MITDEQKHENYIQLKIDLKKAMNCHFWFEACMIEYAIIEDRTSSILSHAGVCKDAYSSSKKLSNKLNSIEYQIDKKHPIISKKVSVDTIREIKKWKDLRNDLVHRSCICIYDKEAIASIASDGKRLVDLISNDSKKVTRLANKMTAISGKEKCRL